MKASEIKKLNKKEIDEGITLDLVNSKGVTEKASPVLFEKAGEIYKLIKCATGFWAIDATGAYVKESGKYKVFPQRDCIIARARYLLLYSEVEKQQEVEKLYEQRKKKAQDALAKYRKNIDATIRRCNGDLDWMVGALISASPNPEAAKAKYDAETEQYKELLPKIEAEYAECEKQLSEGNITGLLCFFGIEKAPGLDEPLMTARYDNADEMRIAVAAFGKQTIDEYAGDMEKHIARLRVEQRY